MYLYKVLASILLLLLPPLPLVLTTRVCTYKHDQGPFPRYLGCLSFMHLLSPSFVFVPTERLLRLYQYPASRIDRRFRSRSRLCPHRFFSGLIKLQPPAMIESALGIFTRNTTNLERSEKYVMQVLQYLILPGDHQNRTLILRKNTHSKNQLTFSVIV